MKTGEGENKSVTAQVGYEIVKVAGSVSHSTATVSKNYGDAPFTNELTKTGDGTVSYASNNTGVATVDSSTGEVTIVGAGEATIISTVADGANYAYATKSASYTLTVSAATMTVRAEGYTGEYDGNPHSITVTVTTPASGATITYGTTEGTYDLTTNPEITNVSDSKTVYFKVTALNYADYTGSAAVTLSKADQETPDAPVAASTSTNSITLNTITNGEYKCGGEWQTSPTFTGLAMNTQYTLAASGWSGESITAEMVADGSYRSYIDAISPMMLVNESTVPTLCAYGPNDKIVPVGIKFKLFEAFEQYNVTYDYLCFEHSGHAMMGDPEMQNKFIDMSLDYCVRYFK